MPGPINPFISKYIFPGADLPTLSEMTQVIEKVGLVVTDDLVWALQNDIIGGAALDVTDPEPLPADHPLWDCPNLIISPHVAGSSGAKGRERLADFVVENMARYVNGEQATHIVDL
mgnify:CR=1 FL=1